MSSNKPNVFVIWGLRIFFYTIIIAGIGVYLYWSYTVIEDIRNGTDWQIAITNHPFTSGVIAGIALMASNYGQPFKYLATKRVDMYLAKVNSLGFLCYRNKDGIRRFSSRAMMLTLFILGTIIFAYNLATDIPMYIERLDHPWYDANRIMFLMVSESVFVFAFVVADIYIAYTLLKIWRRSFVPLKMIHQTKYNNDKRSLVTIEHAFD